MKIQAMNSSKYDSTSFGLKVSPKLQKKLKAEAKAQGEDKLRKVKYQISKVERWGNPESIVDLQYSQAESLNYITIKNPKISKRVYTTITYGTKAGEAFNLLSEGLIKKTEKILRDAICKYDN